MIAEMELEKILWLVDLEKINYNFLTPRLSGGTRDRPIGSKIDFSVRPFF